jgi:hypothetical protein
MNKYYGVHEKLENKVLNTIKRNKITKNQRQFSINRIEDDRGIIQKVNNGTGAALSRHIGKPDHCIEFF